MISLIHIIKKYKWKFQSSLQILGACYSNIRYDVRGLFHLKDILIINSWVDFKKGKIKRRNFGDDFNYYLIKEFTHNQFRFKNCSFLSLLKRTNYLCIGSIIHLGNKNSIIWGAGCISMDSPIHNIKSVLLVRGPKTRERLIQAGIKCPEIYGDPVLLLPLLYNPNIHCLDQIGIILNAADETMVETKSILGNHNTIYISITNYGTWRDVIDKIKQCSMILSSSLHGLIIADAYGIPNLWISVNGCDNIIGNVFKFQDYLLSVNRKQTSPIEFEEIVKEGVDKYKCLIDKPHVNLHNIIKTCPFQLNINTF